MEKILNHGYVRTVNVMGTDLDVVNAARVSFDKEVTHIEDKDQRLIDYLVEHRHDSVLRHCAMTFEIYAPLMIARQWYKHAVGSTHLDDQLGWNESSRRYVTENEQFYVPRPQQWRKAAKNNKQGSDGFVSNDIGAKYSQRLYMLSKEAHNLYLEALDDGVAPEQARLLLPAYAMYVRWRWTASLNALLHFIDLRTDSGAQSEIAEYAQAVADEVMEYFPRTASAWKQYR
jgi:thymidylate synthase (FAD)